MVVAHNLYAMNAQRQYNITGLRKKKSTEKLSSGFKINRAADDAAGLSISEKMRRQIRGLDRGANNIQEGVSLVQTADGALGEVIEILQRIRELSIQSYNETNSESDIAAMQAEVDEALKEIDRIGITTTFNEKKILQGNQATFGGISEISYYESSREFRTIPDWLLKNSDDELKVHSTYTNLQSDTDHYMYQTINREKYHNETSFHSAPGVEYPDGTCIYFGPPNTSMNEVWYGKTVEGAGYTGWSNTIADNPSAKLDFSGLIDVSNVDELYEDMFNLLGTSISYPCGSCSNFQKGIFFSGEEDGFRALRPLGYVDGSYYSSSDKLSTISLTEKFSYDLNQDGIEEEFNGYYDAIKQLKEKLEQDTVSSALDKENTVKDLARAIASNLASRVYTALDSIIDDEHFDRVIPNDPYSLIVYDYRDEDALRIKGITDVGVVNRTGLVEVAEKQTGYKYCTVAGELMIHGGPEAEDKIEISLPKITLEELGLIGYRVGNQYTTDMIITYERDEEMEERAEQEYQKAMEQYEKEMQEYGIAYEVWKNDTSTVQQTITVSTLKGYNWDNGERKEPIFDTQTQTVTKTIYNSPQPKMPKQPVKEEFCAKKKVTYIKNYDEHVLDPVDDAIAKVSAMRAILGAQQNRLEHAYRINKNTEENTQAAESRIRDTDMAEEMVNYSKQNILEQVGQSMIVQANQQNQGVLSLLQ